MASPDVSAYEKTRCTGVLTWKIAAPAVLLSKLARFQGFGGGDKPKLLTPAAHHE
jgi:hypothetical protein